MNPSLALIVEDDSDIAEIVSICLKKVGYHTEIIGDGLEALNRLQIVTPMLIMLDLDLPSRDGLTILKAIRADERLCKTWVVLNTANAMKADYINEIDDDHLLTLVKPVSIAQIMQIGRRLLPTAEGVL